MPIFVDILLALCYIHEERAVTRHEGPKRAIHGQLGGKRGQAHVRVVEGPLIKKRSGRAGYAPFGRNCDRMELINVHFSRIA
jgi:hypothetical protein